MQAVLSAWFWVNIAAPIVLPVTLLLVFQLLPIPNPPDTLHIMSALKDAQLCWAVIAMGASSIYEITQAKPALPPSLLTISVAGLLVTIIPSRLMASGRAVFNTRLLHHSAPSGKITVWIWIRHYRLFVGSAVLTVIAALNYASVHFALPTPP